MSLTTTLDLKAVVQKFHKRPAVTGIEKAPKTQTVVDELSPYILKTLFLPMVMNGEIPTEGLDFSLISEDDLHALRMALDGSAALELFSCAGCFAAMRPSVKHTTSFI